MWMRLQFIAILISCATLVSQTCSAETALERGSAAADICRHEGQLKAETYDLHGTRLVVHPAVFAQPSPDVLCMRGSFWIDSPAKIREIRNPTSVRTLLINSDGGWTEPAIQLAKLAELNHWLVVVKHFCLSSCANYIFLSRADKIVLPNSIVGWHGAPPDPSEFERHKREFPSGPEWGDPYLWLPHPQEV